MMHMHLLSQEGFVEPHLKLCAARRTRSDLTCNHPSRYLIYIGAIKGNQTGAWETRSMKEAPENKCDSVNNRELGTKV